MKAKQDKDLEVQIFSCARIQMLILGKLVTRIQHVQMMVMCKWICLCA